MITPGWPTLVRSLPAQLLRAVDPVAPAAEGAQQRGLLASLAGRTVSALVVSRADDGHGIIKVDGHRLTVAADLPAAGATVVLKFAGTQAQLAASTGLLARPAVPAATTVRTSAAAAPTPASSASSASTAAGIDSALVELGDNALSLGRFAETPLQPLQLGQVAAPIDHPDAWGAAFAQLLRDSGTFYESHLAAWTRGGYPLENIRREPQASAGQVSELPAAAPNAADPTPGRTVASIATAADTNVPERAPAVPTSTPAATTQTQGVPEELHPIVREQLHTLETQTLPFSFDAWPGQRADMIIGREAGRGGNRATPGNAPAWKTSLKLKLPQLGEVSATLNLAGDHLWLDLFAPAGSTGVLNAADGALSNAMRAAGIRLVRTRVLEDGGNTTS